MNFSLFGTAYAQAAEAAAPKAPSMIELFALPAGFLAIMYFFVIRPQAKKHKELQKLVAGLKVGDEVVTTGGIIGKVRSVADTFVTIESMNSQMKVAKAHVAGLTKLPEKAGSKTPATQPANT